MAFFRRCLLMFLLLLAVVPSQALAQGCSDAGVCSLGGVESGSHEDSIQGHQLALSHTLGIGEAEGNIVPIQTLQLKGRYRLSSNSFVEAKLPFQMATGNLGTAYGLGDISLSFSQSFREVFGHRLTLSAGGKLPGNRATLTEDGKPLPMLYQSSLGSYDLLVGASYLVGDWRFALGYQHPFNRNENRFLHSRWPGEKGEAYFESQELLRGDDLMGRVERRFRFGKTRIWVGLLPIMRLQHDRIRREGRSEKLAGSRQLTLNLNFTLEHPLGPHWRYRLEYGNPVIWRRTRADGLTRPVVISNSLLRRF